MNLPPRVVSLLVVSNVICLAVLAVVGLSGFASPDAKFREITAERINIVSPEGKTVIAISNKERVAAPVVAGKKYPVSVSEGRPYMAGMIFFNQEGDEMGGLLFNSFKQPNGRIAGIGHLSFDRYGDNQVVALQYNENASGVRSGLAIYDRPGNGAFPKSLDLIEEARSASPERLAEIREATATMSERGELGVERVFLGSRNEAAQCQLKDTKGRVRARLVVDADDAARLEFLDTNGAVTARYPD